jgi:hypothetical protein
MKPTRAEKTETKTKTKMKRERNGDKKTEKRGKDNKN